METQGNFKGPSSPFEGQGQDVGEQARNTAEKARSQVRSLADSTREDLAERIGGFGRALRDMGEKLRNDDNAQAAHYTDLIGDQAERVSRYLAEHEAGDLIDEVEGFARNHPLLFLGGCVGVGFAVGRFFKASPPEHEQERMPLGVTGEPTPSAVRQVPEAEPVVTEPLVTTAPMEDVRPLGPTGEER